MKCCKKNYCPDANVWRIFSLQVLLDYKVGVNVLRLLTHLRMALSLFMTSAQAVTLAQNHEHTLIHR